MDELQNVMRIIDSNSDKLPEGDYLELCNSLGKVYKQKEKPPFIFDYEPFNLIIRSRNPLLETYFYDYCYDEAIQMDYDYLKYIEAYLEEEISRNTPLIRITKNIKREAIYHHCKMNNIILEEYTIENLKKYSEENNIDIGEGIKPYEKLVRSMCKTYMYVENQMRAKYIIQVREKLKKIHGWLEDLDEI